MLGYKWCTYFMSIANLVITLALVFLVLPASVPIHVNTNLIIDAMGSPFFSILPFALLPVIINSLTVLMRDNSTDTTRVSTYRVRDIFVAIYDVISISIGWLMFTLAHSGGYIGSLLDASPMLVISMIPAGILFIVSTYLPILNARGKGINFTWLADNAYAWRNTQQLACNMGIILSIAIYCSAIVCHLLQLYKVGFLICGVILLMYVILLIAWSIIYNQTNPEDENSATIDSTQGHTQMPTQSTMSTTQSVSKLDELLDKQSPNTHQNVQIPTNIENSNNTQDKTTTIRKTAKSTSKSPKTATSKQSVNAKSGIDSKTSLKQKTTAVKE